MLPTWPRPIYGLSSRSRSRGIRPVARPFGAAGIHPLPRDKAMVPKMLARRSKSELARTKLAATQNVFDDLRLALKSIDPMQNSTAGRRPLENSLKHRAKRYSR